MLGPSIPRTVEMWGCLEVVRYVVASRIVIPRWFVFDKVWKSESINIFCVFGGILSLYKDANTRREKKLGNERSSLERNGVYVCQKNEFIFFYSAKSPSSNSTSFPPHPTESTTTSYVGSRTTWITNYSFHLFSHLHDQWRSGRGSMLVKGKKVEWSVRGEKFLILVGSWGATKSLGECGLDTIDDGVW